MIFNVSGGGGAALNFKVLAYATEEELLAATPAENTIGIITTAPITSWCFSVEEPSPAEPGKIWITIGTSSDVSFNAFKKNTAIIYPISAQQYVSDGWVDVPSKSRQGGEWVEWISPCLLYSLGDERTAVTGGWVGTGYDSMNGGTVQKNDASITVTAEFSSAKAITTQKAVDLRGYSKVKVKLTGHVLGAHANKKICLSLHTDSTPTNSNCAASASTSGAASELEVNVPIDTNSYWISVACVYGPSVRITEVIRE